jgi:hypothetical protein
MILMYVTPAATLHHAFTQSTQYRNCHMRGVLALTAAAAGSALTIRGDMMASEKPPQKRLAIPAPPDEMTPNDTLKHMTRLQYAQVQLLFDLQQEIEEQGRALTDIANDLEDLAKDRDYWARVRREIDWAFWVVIGLPLVMTALFLALLLATGASLFR